MSARYDRNLNRAIRKTRMTISAAEMTIDELMQTLLDNPLPEIDGFMHAMWDYDEPDFLDLFLQEGPDIDDLPKETSQLDQSIDRTTSETQVKQVSKEQVEDESVESEKLNIFEMTSEEILDRIKCRCRELKDQYHKKKSDELSEDAFSMKVQEGSKVRSVRSQHHKYKKVLKVTSEEVGEEEHMPPPDTTHCRQYLVVKDYASFFIDDILVEAETKVNAFLPAEKYEETETYAEETESGEYSTASSTEYSSALSSIQNKDFTPAGGRELILDSIDTWQLVNQWSYCINFIGEDSDTCADYYKYEVIWSTPTANFPIPQVTASVFYTIEVSRVKGEDCPVAVTYNFETERYTFDINDEINHEKFLNGIIKSKKNFFKSLRI